MKRVYQLSLIMLALCILMGATRVASAQNSYMVYFNELRVDDAGADNIEFIELIAPAGLDLSGFVIWHFDGAAGVTGAAWTFTIGSFTVPNDGVTDENGTPLGFYVLGLNGFNDTGVDETSTFNFGGQTGGLLNTTAGLVLYDASDNILDAIAWGSAGDLLSEVPALTTAGDPGASNYLAVTQDLINSNSTLRAPSSVFNDPGTGWEVGAATVGGLNGNQVTGDISLPVDLISFEALAGMEAVTLKWATASEVNNLGFEVYRAGEESGEYLLIASYENDPALAGQLNTNIETRYEYVDNTVEPRATYWYKLTDVSLTGLRIEHGPISATPGLPEGVVADQFKLLQNYPNPFNPATTLQVYVPGNAGATSSVTVEIYNLLGQKVKTLFEGNLPAGLHPLTWRGDSDRGAAVPGGIYFAVLRAGAFQDHLKLALLK